MARRPPLLDEGAVAPDWSLRSHTGTSHHREPGWTVLVFFRDRPACRAQLRRAEVLRPRFEEQGCQLYGVTTADRATVRELVAAERLGYPVLLDEGARLAEAFRATTRRPLGRPRTAPAVFLVNPAGTVRLANRGHPSLEAVLRSIQALRAATPAGM